MSRTKRLISATTISGNVGLRVPKIRRHTESEYEGSAWLYFLWQDDRVVKVCDSSERLPFLRVFSWMYVRMGSNPILVIFILRRRYGYVTL